MASIPETSNSPHPSVEGDDATPESADANSLPVPSILPAAPGPTSNEKIEVHLQAQTGEMFSVLITREMTMGKIMHKYCKVKNLEKLGFRFMLDGLRVVDTDTAGSLGMEDGDTIDVFAEQVGG